METLKVIKTEEEYEQVMAEIDKLLDLDPDAGTPKADRLDLLVLLAEAYEADIVDNTPPTPLEAIEFRMEQQELTPRDLIPYIGSRSKVSEILSGKRALTLPMIRALHIGLGIPLDVLVAENPVNAFERIDWARFPVKEMIKRGWMVAKGNLKNFLTPLSTQAVLYRKSSSLRSVRQMDEYALMAWSVRVMNVASNTPLAGAYIFGSVDFTFMQALVQLSRYDDGPLRAQAYLSQYGIPLVIEKHLPRTYLDGAAMKALDGTPIVALTLRYDRLDNFWFTLMHELAHVSLHLCEGKVEFFYDDLDVPLDNKYEQEADSLANRVLIPEGALDFNPNAPIFTEDVEDLAESLGIHPAIVAGRIRFERKDYRILNNLVGHREVRKLFDF